MGGNQGFNGGLRCGVVVVAVVQGNHFDVGILLFQHRLGAADAELGILGAGLTGQDDNLALAAQLLAEPLGIQSAERLVVYGQGRRHVVGIHAGVEGDHRDAGGHGLIHCRNQSRGGSSRQTDDIHAHGDQVVHIGDLLGRIVVCVGGVVLLNEAGLFVALRLLLEGLHHLNTPCIAEREVAQRNGVAAVRHVGGIKSFNRRAVTGSLAALIGGIGLAAFTGAAVLSVGVLSLLGILRRSAGYQPEAQSQCKNQADQFFHGLFSFLFCG